MNTLRMMTVILNIPLKQSEIRKFRGAIINAAGTENTLFHNHNGQGYDYRYPLIQYRIIRGKAAIVCFNEGAEQMQALFANGFIGSELMIDNNSRGAVMIESIRQNEVSLCELETPIKYHISRWIPLNQQNYTIWKQMEDNGEKLAKLNAILVGNIISLAKGFKWQINCRIKCDIDFESITIKQTRYKDQVLISFSLDFYTNLFLPYGVGLGKNVSANCGVIMHPVQSID